MLQEKPCKHPIQPMKKLKCKAFLHLVFSPPSPLPLRKRLKYLKQFTGICTKGWDSFFFLFFLFVTTWREKIDKMSANAFSHSKRTADLLVALSVIINETNLKRKINADLWGVKQAVRWRWNVRKIARLWQRSTYGFNHFFSFFFLKDAIEGFFDKVANSTKK